MKLVAIDDSTNFIGDIVQAAREAGFEAFGLTGYGPGGRVIDHTGRRTDITIEDAVRGVDILLLDHSMPIKNGDAVLAELQQIGVVTAQTRVIGISAGDQDYVAEQISSMNACDPKFLKTLMEE